MLEMWDRTEAEERNGEQEVIGKFTSIPLLLDRVGVCRG